MIAFGDPMQVDNLRSTEPRAQVGNRIASLEPEMAQINAVRRAESADDSVVPFGGVRFEVFDRQPAPVGKRLRDRKSVV